MRFRHESRARRTAPAPLRRHGPDHENSKDQHPGFEQRIKRPMRHQHCSYRVAKAGGFDGLQHRSGKARRLFWQGEQRKRQKHSQ